MEFSRDVGSATYQIRSYRPGCICINDQNYFTPVLILPEKLIAPWNVKSFEDLKQEDFEAILQLSPQVVLIGVPSDPISHSNAGANLRNSDSSSLLLAKKLILPLTNHGIGVEVMTTSAACRTYTVLMSEGRNVAAGLFLG